MQALLPQIQGNSTFSLQIFIVVYYLQCAPSNFWRSMPFLSQISWGSIFFSSLTAEPTNRPTVWDYDPDTPLQQKPFLNPSLAHPTKEKHHLHSQGIISQSSSYSNGQCQKEPFAPPFCASSIECWWTCRAWRERSKKFQRSGFFWFLCVSEFVRRERSRKEE